jgi:CDP-diacylglycerol--serine O-phosphatidyltransferase
LPNAITLAALCFGIFAIDLSFHGHWQSAFYALVCAAILDLLDGAAARLLHCESRLGARLDSFSDGVNFGLAPAVILWHWTLRDLGWFGLVVAAVFFACTVARLIRFMLTSQSKDVRYFIGVPSPMGAALALLPLALAFHAGHADGNALAVAGWTLVVGMMLIAPMRTPSLKGKRNARMFSIPLVLALAVILAQPWLGLMLLDFGFLTILAISICYHRLPRRETPA